MYSPAGLEGWEIVAASGLCALGFLAIATVFALGLSFVVLREPAPARARADAPVFGAQPVQSAQEPRPTAAFGPGVPATAG